MTIYDCERFAQDNDFEGTEFILYPFGKVGYKGIKCKWLDAYMGIFQMGKVEGFLSVRDITENYPDHFCELKSHT